MNKYAWQKLRYFQALFKLCLLNCNQYLWDPAYCWILQLLGLSQPSLPEEYYWCWSSQWYSKNTRGNNRKVRFTSFWVISYYKKTNGIPITEAQPLSPISKAYRTQRTNIKYTRVGLEMPLRSIIFTSAMESEGKTEVLVNLGIVLAQNKLRVLLLDADLRRLTLHRWLGLDKMVGLSQTFVHPELGAGYSLRPTLINGLTVLTYGDCPPNPSELLGSRLIG